MQKLYQGGRFTTSHYISHRFTDHSIFMYRANVSSELHALRTGRLGARVIAKNGTDTASSPHGPYGLIREVDNRLKCIQCCNRDDTSRICGSTEEGQPSPMEETTEAFLEEMMLRLRSKEGAGPQR